MRLTDWSVLKWLGTCLPCVLSLAFLFFSGAGYRPSLTSLVRRPNEALSKPYNAKTTKP